MKFVQVHKIHRNRSPDILMNRKTPVKFTVEAVPGAIDSLPVLLIASRGLSPCYDVTQRLFTTEASLQWETFGGHHYAACRRPGRLQ